MTASATTPTREKAERAREDCEYVRSLPNVRQPQFAAALEAVINAPRASDMNRESRILVALGGTFVPHPAPLLLGGPDGSPAPRS